MRIRNTIAALSVTALLPIMARAEGIEGRWTVGFNAGTDVDLSGNVHEGGEGTVLGLPTGVDRRSFSDVYDRSVRGQLSVGYGIAPRGEVFLRGSYYKANSSTLRVGDVAGLDLNADFADYRELGVEAGYRHHFAIERPLKPYVALTAGMRFLDNLPSTFSVPAAGVVLNDVPFYDDSTVGVFGADLGFSYDVTPTAAIGIETGVRYQTSPSRLDGLSGTGLEAINDTGSRWSMPLHATLTFRF